MTSPFLFFDGDRLTDTELRAAVLDGVLVPLGEGYLAADAVETPALRAGSLRPLVGDDTAATHESAAWILGAIEEPPRRHSVQRIAAVRTRQRIDPRYLYRDTRMPLDDVRRIGGIAVSSPVRTILDLLRCGGDAEAIGRLLRQHPGTFDQALTRLAQGRLPGKLAAMAALHRYEEVTRYTS